MIAIPPSPTPRAHQRYDNQTDNTTLPLPPSRLRSSSPAYQSFYSPSIATPFYTPSGATPFSSGNPSPHLNTNMNTNTTMSRIKSFMARNTPSYKGPNLILHQPRRTHPMVWCAAALCLFLILLLIFFAISTLILFLVINPKHPIFDIPSANLNMIYFGGPDIFKVDFSLIANFTNPNHKIDLRYKKVDLQLVFSDRVISSQLIPPFELKRGGKVGRWVVVRIVTNLVKLPLPKAGELQRTVASGRVQYEVKGRFRVQATVTPLGDWCKFSYWQRATCQLAVTSPPTSLLVARNCSLSN